MSNIKPYLSIVIPVFDEEKQVVKSLTKITKFFNKFDRTYEVIVVDDGSSDGTVNQVESFVEDNSNYYLIKNPHKGKGFAIRTGVQRARGDLIYLADIDLATPIDDLERFIFWIKEHDFDLVIGSREGMGAKRIGEPYYRHLMGRIFNLLIKIVVGLPYRDTQCGFKLFKNEIAKKLFSLQRLYGDDSQVVSGSKLSAYDVEILFLAGKLGYRVKELPVTWEFGQESKVDPIRDSWINFFDVIKVRINDIRGEYKVIK